MTISGTTFRNSYNGNGSTDTFTYGFRVLDDDHVAVYVGGVLQTLTTHYSVTGVGNATGSIVFVTPPATGTGNVVFVRNVPITQLTDYVENDPFPAETHEDALDKLTMILQQQQEIIDRSLQISVTDAASIGDLPAVAARASKFLAFDASGDPIASSGAVGTVPISTFMETVLDDTSAGAALTTLGISAFIQTVLNDADATTARATLGLVIGTDVLAPAGSGASLTGILKNAKVVTATRDVSLTSNQAITGAGFTPKAVFIIAGSTSGTGIVSIGFADVTAAGVFIHSGIGAYFVESDTTVARYMVDGSNQSTASVSSFDAGGMTLAWSKVGSPTGTAQLRMLFVG